MASRAFLSRIRGGFRSRACPSSLGIFAKGAVGSAGPMEAWSEAAALHGIRKAFLHADGRAALASSRAVHSSAAAKTERFFGGREGSSFPVYFVQRSVVGLAFGRLSRRFHVLALSLPGNTVQGSLGLPAWEGARQFHVLRDPVMEHADEEAQEDDHDAKISAYRHTHQLEKEVKREREAYCTTMPDKNVVVEEYNEEDEAMRARFEEWMKEYDRTYKDEVEKARRFKIFKAVARCVDVSNAEAAQAGHSTRSGLNEFSDWNAQEMLRLGGVLFVSDEENQMKQKTQKD